MDEGLPWYKRYPHRFIDGAQGLGPECIGAYAMLLDLIYARGGHSTRDDRHLAGILGCSTRKARALTDRLISLGKIREQDGDLSNARAEMQANRARIDRESAASWGRIGAEIRHGRKENNALDMGHPIASRAELDEDKSLLGATILKIVGFAGAGAGENLGAWRDLPQFVTGWRREFDLDDHDILRVVRRVMSRRKANPRGPAYFNQAMHDEAMRKAGIDVPFKKRESG